jgi:Protein of unknown function (DUF3800)
MPFCVKLTPFLPKQRHLRQLKAPKNHALRLPTNSLYFAKYIVTILSYRSDYRTVIVAALTAYFDDSGTHDDSATVVVAGFVSSAPQWRRFTREWNKAKAEYEIKDFHFAQFLANQKDTEFADKKKWNDTRKEIVLRRLRSIAFTHSIHAFSCSVDRRDYDEVFSDSVREEFGGHFTWSVRAVLGFIENWRIKHQIKEPIEYIFSTMNGKPKREIEGVFDGALKTDNPLYKYGIQPGCHSFRDMREILPLQAADMLAGCVYQADKVRVKGMLIPQYVADTFNYFLMKKGFFDSKNQRRDSLERIAAIAPHLMVPENRTPKPTPKGTKPNPSKKINV